MFCNSELTVVTSDLIWLSVAFCSESRPWLMLEALFRKLEIELTAAL